MSLGNIRPNYIVINLEYFVFCAKRTKLQKVQNVRGKMVIFPFMYCWTKLNVLMNKKVKFDFDLDQGTKKTNLDRGKSKVIE